MSSCVELLHDPRHCVWTGHWSAEQQQCLWEALRRFGPRDVPRIASKVPGKNLIQVAARLHCLQTATLVYERTTAVGIDELEPASEADEGSDDDSVAHSHNRSSHHAVSLPQHNTQVQQPDQNSCESSACSADDGSSGDSCDESIDMSSADEAGDEPEAQQSDSDSESASQASDASDQETSDQEDSSDQTVADELSSRNVISHARLRRFLKRKAEDLNEPTRRPGHAAVMLERGLRSWLTRVMPLIDAMRFKRWHTQCLSQSRPPQPESQSSQPLSAGTQSMQTAPESEQLDASESEDDERVTAKDVHAALATCIPTM